MILRVVSGALTVGIADFLDAFSGSFDPSIFCIHERKHVDMRVGPQCCHLSAHGENNSKEQFKGRFNG